ncbi:hypothetical protein D9M73_258540 [compost metagenome]
MEFHIRAQFERINQAVGGNVPALGQAWYQLAAGCIEIEQAVHQHVGRSIGRGQRVVLNHVEAFRTGLGAHTQGGGMSQQGAEQGSEQQR